LERFFIFAKKRSMPTTYGLPKKREEVLNLLQQAFVDQNLEEQDYEQRLGKALSAKSIEELNEVIADFPERERKPIQTPQRSNAEVFTSLGKGSNFSAVLSKQTSWLDQKVSNPIKSFVLMGEQNLSLAEADVEGKVLSIESQCFMGSLHLDLRAHKFEGKHVLIDLTLVMGEVRIRLPKGCIVENQISPILGEVSHSQQKLKRWISSLFSKQSMESRPISLKVSLLGFVTMGSVVFVHD
jgi:hypothetical protein